MSNQTGDQDYYHDVAATTKHEEEDKKYCQILHDINRRAQDIFMQLMATGNNEVNNNINTRLNNINEYCMLARRTHWILQYSENNSLFKCIEIAKNMVPVMDRNHDTIRRYCVI